MPVHAAPPGRPIAATRVTARARADQRWATDVQLAPVEARLRALAWNRLESFGWAEVNAAFFRGSDDSLRHIVPRIGLDCCRKTECIFACEAFARGDLDDSELPFREGAGLVKDDRV